MIAKQQVLSTKQNLNRTEENVKIVKEIYEERLRVLLLREIIDDYIVEDIKNIITDYL